MLIEINIDHYTQCTELAFLPEGSLVCVVTTTTANGTLAEASSTASCDDQTTREYLLTHRKHCVGTPDCYQGRNDSLGSYQVVNTTVKVCYHDGPCTQGSLHYTKHVAAIAS